MNIRMGCFGFPGSPFFNITSLVFLMKKRACLYLLPAMALLGACRQDQPLFKIVPASRSHIEFSNQLQPRKAFGILYYLYYYNGGGVATGDINNDGLPDIYFTANEPGANKLYLNKGNMQFEDITATAGVAGTADWCSGVTMADVDGDGLLDIYVSVVANHHGLTGHNELFLNQGKGIFKPVAQQYGLDFSGFTTQAAFFDFDKDGDLDCYLLNQSHKPNENIVDTSRRRIPDANAGDRLYRNDLSTTGVFTDISAAAGIYQGSLGYGLGLAIADFNNDGADDIYVGNDFHENDYYYLNNRNGTFTESGAAHFGHYSRFSMGNDAADLNNDGQTDLVTVDMLPPDEKILKTYGSDENPDIYRFKLMRNGFQYQYSRNTLQRNNGNGVSFSETGLQAGISATDWSWSALAADYDNDGYKDVFISSGIVKRPVDLDYVRFISELFVHKTLNSTDKYDQTALDKMPDGNSHPFLFKGAGDFSFTDISAAAGFTEKKGYYNGAAYADLDNDGDLDLVINCLESASMIWENTSSKKNYLSLHFAGLQRNKNGIGVKAWVYAGGQMQYQQLMPTRGFQSSVDLRLHFGLDQLQSIDSVQVVWPSGASQTILHPTINKSLLVEEKQADKILDLKSQFPAYTTILDILPDSALPFHWNHKENDFFDVNVQYLIPHGESTRGPHLAKADVNADGFDDFFVCGAAGQPGVLMLQQSSGKFLPADTALFSVDAGSEDVDGLFFDADRDGDPDLYVVSGGNEYKSDDPRLADRLYINDGKGHFAKKTGALPSLLENKSCVTAADIDQDGDLDLFVGNLANPKAYGLPQTSWLLLNNGKGDFTVAPQTQMDLREIGLVSSASFGDLDKDGWPDLVVVGEWMPITIFKNKKGSFGKQKIAASSGLWQRVELADINADGTIDILAGNWGHNNKFYAGKQMPLKCYVKDFDRNGSVEQVMAYTIDGKEYPFLAKDELERALPVLKKGYLTYGEVAGKTVQEIFDDLFKDYTELKVETLSSTIFLNDGKAVFSAMPLPEDFQVAPVFAFCPVETSVLTGGNFYNVIPYEGRYDALFPLIGGFDGKLFRKQQQIAALEGEIRDMKWIKRGKKDSILLICRNNASLKALIHTNAKK